MWNHMEWKTVKQPNQVPESSGKLSDVSSHFEQIHTGWNGFWCTSLCGAVFRIQQRPDTANILNLTAAVCGPMSSISSNIKIKWQTIETCRVSSVNVWSAFCHWCMWRKGYWTALTSDDHHKQTRCSRTAWKIFRFKLHNMVCEMVSCDVKYMWLAVMQNHMAS